MQGLNSEVLKMLQAQTGGGSAPLTILAGRCVEKTVDGKQWLSADKTKGQIELRKDPQGLFWKFQWKNLMSGEVKLDLTVIQETAKWYHLDYVEDGKVFELRLGPKKHWFWMQQQPEEDMTDEKLQEQHKKLRNILKHGSLDAPATSANTTSQQQQPNAPAAPGAAPGTGGAGTVDQTKLMEAIVKAMANTNLQTGAQGGNRVDINVSQLLENKTMLKVLEDPEAVKELLSHGHDKLKEGGSKEDLKKDLESPQLASACRILTRVIRSGGSAVLISELGIKDQVVSVKDFVEKLNEHYNKMDKDDEKAPPANDGDKDKGGEGKDKDKMETD